MKPQNPFVVSGYVSPEFFCNRQKETKKIISMKHKLHTPSSVQTAFKALLEKEMIYKENEFYFVYDVFLERWLELH